jgi:hypothetical protein
MLRAKIMTKMVTLQTYIKIIHGKKKTINNDDWRALSRESK